MRSISFDLDGVLIHSEPLVRRAYARAGITLSDDAWRYAWGKSWSEWLPPLVGGCFEARAIHEAKNRAYARILRDEEILGTTAVRYLRELIESNLKPLVVSCASEVAATLVLQRLRLEPFNTYVGLSRQEKVNVINARDLIHIDDDRGIIESIRDGILYTDQSIEELRYAVKVANVWMP